MNSILDKNMLLYAERAYERAYERASERRLFGLFVCLFACVSICLFLSATFQTYENWIESWIYHAMRISNALCRVICRLLATVSRFSQWDSPVSDGNDLCLLFAPLDITFFWLPFGAVASCWWLLLLLMMLWRCYCHCWCVSSDQLNSTYTEKRMYIEQPSQENDCNTHTYTHRDMYKFLNRIRKGI